MIFVFGFFHLEKRQYENKGRNRAAEKNNLTYSFLFFGEMETQGSVLYVRRLKRLKTLKYSLKKTQKTFKKGVAIFSHLLYTTKACFRR